MTPLRAALLLSAEALALNQPLGETLRRLGHRRAADEVDSGALASGLRTLGLEKNLAVLVSLWPASLGPTLRRFDQLPSINQFRLLLGETLAWFTLVLLVQLSISLVLVHKVLPALVGMGAGRAEWLQYAPHGVSLLLVLLGCFAVWALVGASDWTRLPGWGQHVQRAREAAQLAALFESAAPEDVRAQAIQRFVALRDPSLMAGELDELFLDACASAEVGSTRFLSALRAGGYLLLTLLALALVVAVYGSFSLLPGPM
ncbi:MAG: hypothetical protein Q8K32_02185 [Archangium sp.]|nr:hypothetical protein [Archangium sp.]